MAALEASGGAQENGTKKAPEPPKKRGKKEKNVSCASHLTCITMKLTSVKVDMEQLADRMQRLQEDDLLQVVQMIHDQKSPETYTKNDVDAGEFHVDLYTLPDNLVKTLWDFTASKVDV